VIAAASDARETIRRVASTTAKAIVGATSAVGSRARSAPAEVATALPPRKPANTGHAWPTAARNPATNGSVVSSGRASPASVTDHTARSPLAASRTATARPAFQPSNREMFVAPVAPLPCSRTSVPARSLETTTPEGIDPRA
jgi:hypothetical protein